MGEINKIAVVGSGVMGAAIAGHIANAGVEVLLFDIVPEGADDRNKLAKDAIEKLLNTDPAPLAHKRNAKRITPCNLEDDLEKLAEVDWIIEAIIERLDIKQDLYRKVNGFKKPGCIVSSNTSTLPLHALIEGMPDAFAREFMITHFFNPPRYMRLLELVNGEKTSPQALDRIREFCDVRLGKGVVDCKDTPGFLANRIGCYWLQSGLMHAVKQTVPLEVADAVMGKPVGVPKTGIFGLMDLIGIDLLPLIGKALLEYVPKDDGFRDIYVIPERISQMINEGYTGRKGKGGFYRLNTDGGKKVKEALNLKTGEYHTADKPKLESVEAAKQGLRHLVTADDEGGKYAWLVLRDTIHYAASLIPEISDDILSVDRAMKWGYNWKYGPFELIDRFGEGDETGVSWFVKELEKANMEVPQLLKNANGKPLYKTEDGERKQFAIGGSYEAIPVESDAWSLADIKRDSKPVLKNPSAAVWDVGDGVLCFEHTGKMNTFDPLVLDLLKETTELVKADYKALIIGNDGDNFSVGANIGFFLYTINIAGWKVLEKTVKDGQDAFMGLKYAPFPVVAAPSGMALGGGCEILLHVDAVQAHLELYAGLVEVGIGVVPGWGGCKEMIYRHLAKEAEKQSFAKKVGGMFSFLPPVKTLNTMPAISEAFQQIGLAKVAKSAEQAKDMLILNEKSRITMNRARVLADAKALALDMAEDYTPPEPYTISLPGKTARTALHMAIRGLEKSGKALKHDVVVAKHLAEVLSGGNTSITKEITEQDLLDLERKAFMELVHYEATQARIEYMLENNKPLRN